jgi:hypothetical protein
LLLLRFGEQTQKEAAPLFINYHAEQSTISLNVPMSNGAVMVLISVALVHDGATMLSAGRELIKRMCQTSEAAKLGRPAIIPSAFAWTYEGAELY